MGMVELFVPIAAFISFTMIVSLVTRLFATGMLHRTIREAMRSDPGSVPLLANRLEARQPWADSLLGWILLAVALALAVLALTEPDADDRSEILRAAIVPLIVGVSVLVYIRFAKPMNA